MLTCPHVNAESDTHFAWFTGKGNEHHVVCDDCAKHYPNPVDDWIVADAETIKALTGHFAFEGIVGQPEIRTRTSNLRFEHQLIRTPFSEDSKFIDIQPISSGGWACLLTSSEIAILDKECQQRIRSIPFTTEFEIDAEVCLRVSATEDYFAIFQASGSHGSVFNSDSGKLVLPLDRGDYRPKNSFFPFAFLDDPDDTLIVTATAWNRLDIFDLATGENLTPRESPEYESGQPQPPHYLDYFHAQLLISPDRQYIVDNGWAWAPVGFVRAWSLNEWRNTNPWESEDGPTLCDVSGTAYFWDGPLCWIGPHTLAVWGWGADDDWMIPAVRFVDVATGEQFDWFAGPQVRQPTAWPPKKLTPSLIYDGYLFSIGEEGGTAVWDITTGEQLCVDPTLAPIHYHPVNHEFVTLIDSGIQLSRLVE